MRPVYQTCEPRPDVLKGEIKEDIFAARLSDVIFGIAPDVYRDPAIFFENTFPTEGLLTLMREVFGRLSGKGSGECAIVRLETSFGGGKTHSLIALYHVAKNATHIPSLDGLLPPEFVPPREASVVALVGDEYGTAVVKRHNDGTETRTLWGELAYQLGAYDLMRQRDESFESPEQDLLREVIGDQPTLIMIDEVAAYLRTAKTKSLGSSTLAGATVPFLQRLFGLAVSQPNVVVVYTLADSHDAYAAETEEVHQAARELREARYISARQERVLTPTQETEIAPIVNHRLFARIDRDAAREAAERYGDYYADAYEKGGVALPARAARGEYRREIEQAYPFHPEILDVLNRKVATVPNFQKTRGALRLLAMTVRQVWKERAPDACLIHPYHVDLSMEGIRNDLTSRLDRSGLGPAIEADIFSKKGDSHAQEMDADWKAKGQPPLCRRVCQTVFLHSIVHGRAAGAEASEVNLSAGQPGVDFSLIAQTLDFLEEKGWHFDFDGKRYRFQVEPALPKIIEEEMSDVGTTRAKEELLKRIREVYAERQFETVWFPDEPADLDDNARKPKLAVIHFDAETAIQGGDPPNLVKKLFERAGVSNTYREYQNNVLFLVCSGSEKERMVEAAQRVLALAALTGKERLKEFNKEQQDRLKGKKGTAELELRVAITQAYRHLFYPDTVEGGLKHHVLRVQETSDASKDQQAELIRVLRDLKKVMTADDAALSGEYAKEKVWASGITEMTTAELQRAFCRKRVLPIVLDPDQFKRTLKDGVAKGVWVYQDGTKVYQAKTEPPIIMLCEDHTLYLPERARELGLLDPPKPKRAVETEERGPEEMAEGGAGFGGSTGGGIDLLTPNTTRVEAEGVPKQAFANLADRCQDLNVEEISGLIVKTTGISDAKLLGQLPGQLPSVALTVEQELLTELEGDRFDVKFRGSARRFGRFKALTEATMTEAERLKVSAHVKTSFRVEFDAPISPADPVIGQIRDALHNLGVSRVSLLAFTGKEE